MYTILDKTEKLTYDEIKNKYDGKWVYLTNCEFSDSYALLFAIPRVIADKQFDGFDEGIYEIYKNKEVYGRTTDLTFYEIGCLIKSINFIPKDGHINAISNVHI